MINSAEDMFQHCINTHGEASVTVRIVGEFTPGTVDHLHVFLHEYGARIASRLDEEVDILFAGNQAGHDFIAAQWLEIPVAYEREILQLLRDYERID